MRRKILQTLLLDIIILQATFLFSHAKRHRKSLKPGEEGVPSVSNELAEFENNPLVNQIDFIWSTQTVAAGDTAVLHCSFDAIFQQLRNGMIDWTKESSLTPANSKAVLLATGKKVVIRDRRYRVYRPHNSALSVLIVRRTKKRDAGIFKCNLSGSSTRHKYILLNITESKIEAQTSPARVKVRVGKDFTMWCNATGYPKAVVYWTREDSNRRLKDGSYQFWGNGLSIKKSTVEDTGIYACYLDNFVQPVVSYKFSLVVEDRPWHLDGYKMRFDSSQWFPHNSPDPKPVQGKSYLLMCETRGIPKPLPQITWYKDDKRVRNSRHFYIIEDRPEWRTGYTSSTLVIMKFVPRHQANYTCVATNTFRAKRREFRIEDYEPPVKGSGGATGHSILGNAINVMPVPDNRHRLMSDSHEDDDDDEVHDIDSRPSVGVEDINEKGSTRVEEPWRKDDRGSAGPDNNDDEDYSDGSGSGFQDQEDGDDESDE